MFSWSTFPVLRGYLKCAYIYIHKNLSNSMVLADRFHAFTTAIFRRMNSSFPTPLFIPHFLLLKRHMALFSTVFYTVLHLTSSLVCYASCASPENIAYCVLNLGLQDLLHTTRIRAAEFCV